VVPPGTEEERPVGPGRSGVARQPDFGTPWPFGPINLIAIPLCSNGPGNFGSIDWDSSGGGVAQLGR